MKLLQTHRVFVLILGLGLFTMAARPVTDPDMWWHLRTGQLIIQNHQVFHADPYSFTKAGQPWVDHEWLSQVLIFTFYRLAGWGGLIAGFAAIIAAAFLLVFVRSPGRPYMAGMMTAWAAMASIPSWGARPQMLTLLMASVFLWVLERSYDRRNLLWLLPPLMVLWVNLHAGYAVGIGVLVLFLAGDLFAVAVDEKHPPGQLRTLALVLAACLVVVPLNPYGIRMYRYPLETLHSRSMLAYIGEWASPDFHQGRYLPVLFMVLATVALPAISPRRLRPREVLLLAATMFAALRSVRHVPIYAIVAAPLLSAMIQAWIEKSGGAHVFTLRPGARGRSKMVFNAALLAGFLGFSAARFHYVLAHQSASEAKEFPAAAAAFLASARPPGRVMNHYNWGGYFIWKLYPEDPVYIDGRADLYGDQFMEDFAATYYLRGPAWAQALERWEIRTVVLPPDAPLVTALRATPGWAVIFSDGQAVVLSKQP